MTKLISRVAIAVGLALCAAGTAWTQTYPSRPIRWIVPFPAGGAADLVSRILVEKLSSSLGQQIVIDNRGGAGGVIGTDIVAKAAPNGYTIGTIIFSHMVNPALFRKLPYDSANDFAFITLIANGLFVLLVHPSVRAASLKELVAYAKVNPAKLNGAVIPGTIGHLALERMKSIYNIDIATIPYKGAAPAVTDLLGGQVQILFTGFGPVQQFIKSGKLRALAVTSAQRSPVAPELPTAAELGAEGLVLTDWWGVVAPARTDKVIVARLNAEIVKVLALPDVKDRLFGLGAEIVASKPEEFDALIRAGIPKWSKLAQDAGIKPE